MTRRALRLTITVLGVVTLVIVAARRQHRALDASKQYRAALEDRQRLLDGYRKGCLVGEAPPSCAQAIRTSVAARKKGDLAEAQVAIQDALDTCWCYSAFQDELRAAREAVRAYERENGWHWGTVGS